MYAFSFDMKAESMLSRVAAMTCVKGLRTWSDKAPTVTVLVQDNVKKQKANNMSYR